MTITDINCDCGPYAFREYPQTSATEIASELERLGISCALIGSARAITFASPHPANELLAEELAALSSPALLPAATLSPAYPGVEADFARCVDLGFRALRLYPTYHDFDLTSYEAVRLADLATEAGWPVLVCARVEDERHHHPLMKVPGLPVESAVTFARNASRARIVLCTGTAPEVVKLLTDVPREGVYADISFVKSPLNAIEDLIGKVGSERLLFGTHLPFCYGQTALAKVQEACISEEAKSNLLFRNASRLLD